MIIDEAVEVLRTLPEDVQAAAARAILDYGADHDNDPRLSDVQAAEIERRLADPNRAMLSFDEVHNRLRPFGI